MIILRPSWDEYFMEIADVVKTRSTCSRRQVGAVIVKNKQILTTGYNGAPKGIEHCDTRGCLKAELNIPSGQGHDLCIAMHAEQNAIVQAAYHGISIKDSVLYVTTRPCILCAKMCINAGISKIVYKGDYPDDISKNLLDESGIEIIKFK